MASQASLQSLQPSTEASVEGIIKSMSPLKTSRKGTHYYNFTIVDGSNAVGGVCFDPESHSTMKDMYQNKTTIKLAPVVIKRQRDSSAVEIVANKKSKLMKSESMISDDVPDPDRSMFTSLKDVQAESDNTFNVQVKVVRLDDVEEIQKDGVMLKKRTVVIADSTATCHLSLWENNIDCLEQDRSYRLINVKAKVFSENVHLTLTSSTVMHIIDDIGDVHTEVKPSNLHKVTCTTGEIVGCKNVNVFHSCLFCAGKLRDPHNQVTICTVCGASLKVSCCPKDFSCTILVQESDTRTRMELTAFAQHLLPFLPSSWDKMDPNLLAQEIINSTGTVQVEHDNAIVNWLKEL